LQLTRLIAVSPKGLGFFDTVFHAVTFAFNDRKIGMMKEAVEESGGKCGIVIKDAGPLFKRLVGGQ
jgi:hypothetical protein